MAWRLTTSHTLVRAGGVWDERPIEEDTLPLAAVETADQVRGAQRGVTWVLGRGRVHDVPDDIAAELRDAGVALHGEMRRPDGLHGVLLQVADPVPRGQRIAAPAMSAEAAAIIELRAIVDQQGAELAELRKKK